MEKGWDNWSIREEADGPEARGAQDTREKMNPEVGSRRVKTGVKVGPVSCALCLTSQRWRTRGEWCQVEGVAGGRGLVS